MCPRWVRPGTSTRHLRQGLKMCTLPLDQKLRQRNLGWPEARSPDILAASTRVHWNRKWWKKWNFLCWHSRPNRKNRSRSLEWQAWATSSYIRKNTTWKQMHGRISTQIFTIFAYSTALWFLNQFWKQTVDGKIYRVIRKKSACCWLYEI